MAKASLWIPRDVLVVVAVLLAADYGFAEFKIPRDISHTDPYFSCACIQQCATAVAEIRLYTVRLIMFYQCKSTPIYWRYPHNMWCRVYVTVSCPSVYLSHQSTSAACRSPGAGSRYRSTAAGARAAAAGSVMLRAEVRGSTQTGSQTLRLSKFFATPTSIYGTLQCL